MLSFDKENTNGNCLPSYFLVNPPPNCGRNTLNMAKFKNRECQKIIRFPWHKTLLLSNGNCVDLFVERRARNYQFSWVCGDINNVKKLPLHK